MLSDCQVATTGLELFFPYFSIADKPGLLPVCSAHPGGETLLPVIWLCVTARLCSMPEAEA